MDRDQPGVAKRTTDTIKLWPPGLPVFGLLTPYPATPLYDRLREEGRLTRPKHWLDFRPFRMAFNPKSISIEQAETEVREAWSRSYDPQAVADALEKISHRPFSERAVLLCTRLLFRGIYFPQMTRSQWIRLLISYRRSILRILREGFNEFRRKKEKPLPAALLVKQIGD
jgi:hypothetical protein